MSERRAWIWWAATRGLMLAVALLGPRGVMSDVGYYLKEVATIPADPRLLEVMPEYPVPVVAALAVPWLLGARFLVAYAGVFVGAMLAVDALVFRWLRRRGGPGAVFWLAFLPLLGPVVFFRFDLVVTALLLLALSPLARPDTRSTSTRGALLAGATAVKVWPLVLLAPVVARFPRGLRLQPVTWTLAWGALLALPGLVWTGWDRFFAPLTHQGDRGFELGSVLATPMMLERAFGGGRHQLASDFGAVQVDGPWLDATSTAGQVALVLFLLVAAALSVRLLRAAEPSDLAVLLVALAIVAAFVVTNRVLSPQYVLWFAAPIAAMGVEGRAWRGWGLAAAGATQLVFPVAYFSLFDAAAPALQPATLVLAGRNLLLMVFAVWAIVAAWSATGARARHAVVSAAGRPG